MKKICTFFLAFLMILTCFTSCHSSSVEEGTTEKVGLISINAPLSTRTVALYRDGNTESIELAFFDEVGDVPLICLDSMVSLLNDHVQKNRDEAYCLTCTVGTTEAVLTRDNGSYCRIDLENGTLFFDDYNKFHMFSFELGSLDILESDGYNEQGEAEYFKRVMCSEKSGQVSFVELHKRGIPTVLRGDRAYITLQTFSDLFLTPYEVVIAYNGAECFFMGGDLLGELESTYYTETGKERSEELIDLTYRQLCLLLDFHYGLKEQHGFTHADAYIEQIGLKDDFYSKDMAVSLSALKTLVYKYLSDNHSGVLLHSPYHTSPNPPLELDEVSVGYWEFYRSYQYYNELREEQFDGEIVPYSEIGDTAFIVFNNFQSSTVDYYENSPVDGAYSDEIGLISYAHAMITREDSPIENVVIDLATNTGGHMDGGVYLAAWVLGNAVMHLTDPIRGAESTFIYKADVNLDRVFDEKDTIADKNVYLLTSPITFSCANYVASAFKESGKVTILGTNTGGGTSCVYMAPGADGSVICFSSTLCMSAYKNGTYSLIDAGIAPDVKISDVKDIFNYDKVAEIIKTLP